MSSLLLPVLLLAAEPPSMLPLSDQMLLAHFGGETAPPANSGYGSNRRRRRMAELTAENTNRIRIHVDYRSLDEATAPLYSACFQVGAWYARGLAGPAPPADGVATCQGQISGAHTLCLSCAMHDPPCDSPRHTPNLRKGLLGSAARDRRSGLLGQVRSCRHHRRDRPRPSQGGRGSCGRGGAELLFTYPVR